MDFLGFLSWALNDKVSKSCVTAELRQGSNLPAVKEVLLIKYRVITNDRHVVSTHAGQMTKC